MKASKHSGTLKAEHTGMDGFQRRLGFAMAGMRPTKGRPDDENVLFLVGPKKGSDE